MEFEGIATALGLEWKMMLAFAFLVVCSLEIAKDYGVKKRWLFVPGFLISLALNWAYFRQPQGLVDEKLLIFGTIVVMLLAMGGNAKLKNIAHKWGRPSSKETTNGD